MKQKVVFKVSMNTPKSRSKAMKIAVGDSGVESAKLQGQEKNILEVIGDGIDVVVMTDLLRRNLGNADLVSVSQVGGGQTTEKKTEATVQPLIWSYCPNGVPPIPYLSGHRTHP